MPRSNGFTVPSDRFKVEVLAEDPWRARVVYRIREGRRFVPLVHVTLRERPNGKIQYDQGSGEQRVRPSTGTKNRQKAVDYATQRLGPLAKRVVGQRSLDRSVERMEGDLTPRQVWRLYADARMDEVTKDTILNLKRAAWFIEAVKGADFLPSMIHDPKEFEKEIIAARMKGGVTLSEDGDFARPTLKPASYNLALKDFTRYERMVRFAAKRRNPEHPSVMMQTVNPFDDGKYKVPRPERSTRKRTLGFELLDMLLNGYAEDDPSPLDAQDEDGSTKLVMLLIGLQGMRRGTAANRQRKHFAFTREEIRQMLAVHGPYLNPDDLDEYAERDWVLHSDTKMEYRNPTHYIRPIPLHPVIAAYVRDYFTRHGLWDAEPETYVTSAQGDRSAPIGDTTLFNLPAYAYLKEADGTEVEDARGWPVPRMGEDGLLIVRKGKLHKMGRYDAALRMLRKQILDAGDNWEEIVPFRYREGVSGFRNGVEQTYVRLGWLRKHETASGQKANTSRIVDYLLNRAMSDDVQAEHYQFLEPELLLAGADFVQASVACARLEEEAADDTHDALSRLSQGLGIPDRNLRAV